MNARRSRVFAALAVFAAGAALAAWAARESRRSGVTPHFYQEEFAPAVMLACGRGYANAESTGPLGDFLLQRAETVPCSTLDQNAIVPLTQFQRISPYLELSAAAVWRVFGPSWRAIVPLYAIFGGFVALALYGIMRLGLNVPLACAAALMTLTSPLHLTSVPELRDYSKAPFILALILVIGVVVLAPVSPARLYLLMAAAGIVAGIGFGFRTDILIMVLPLVLAVLCFRKPVETSRWHSLSVGARGIAVFAVVFTAVAWPVLRGYSRGGNTAHVALLGLSKHFDAPLGVENRHYELSPLYLDAYEQAVVRDYARRTGTSDASLSLGEHEYDKVGTRYLLHMVSTFPADVLIRGVASTIKIVNMAFTEVSASVPGWVQNPAAARIYRLRNKAVPTLPGLGALAAMLVALGLLSADMRMGLFFVFLAIFMMASAALQFGERHLFYLEFIGWWVAAVAGVEVFAIISGAIEGRGLAPWITVPALARAAIVLGVLAITTVLAVWSVRWYQQWTLKRLFAAFLAAPSTDGGLTTRPAADGRLLLVPHTADRMTTGRDRTSGYARAEYLRLEIEPSRCQALRFDATIRYEAGSPDADFTHRISVPLTVTDSSITTIMLPVFATETGLPPDRKSSVFDGIELEPDAASCIRSVRWVSDSDVPDTLSTVMLASDWQTADHYQTLAAAEHRYDGSPWTTLVYSSPVLRNLNRRIVDAPVEPIHGDEGLHVPQLRFVGPCGIEMTSRRRPSYSYLLVGGDRPQGAGRYAIAEGNLLSGGITFGLLKDQSWYQQVRITSHGHFIAVAQTLEPGRFAIVLSNENDSVIQPTSFRIDKIGWTAQ